MAAAATANSARKRWVSCIGGGDCFICRDSSNKRHVRMTLIGPCWLLFCLGPDSLFSPVVDRPSPFLSPESGNAPSPHWEKLLNGGSLPGLKKSLRLDGCRMNPAFRFVGVLAPSSRRSRSQLCHPPPENPPSRRARNAAFMGQMAHWKVGVILVVPLDALAPEVAISPTTRPEAGRSGSRTRRWSRNV